MYISEPGGSGPRGLTTLSGIRNMDSPRRAVCVLTMAAALLAAGCQEQSGAIGGRAAPKQSDALAEQAGFGVVVGQINACIGLDTRIGPAPPAADHRLATVVVLRGRSSWVPSTGGGRELALPTE